MCILQTEGCNIFENVSSEVKNNFSPTLTDSKSSEFREKSVDWKIQKLSQEGKKKKKNSMHLQNYERILDLMRDIILATDLAHHLKIMKDLERMAEGSLCGACFRNETLLSWLGSMNRNSQVRNMDE